MAPVVADTVHYVMQGTCTAAIVAAIDDESTAELWTFHSQAVGQGQGFSYVRAARFADDHAEGTWHARDHSAG